mgnify:CR=1 FL=1|jgi:endonuclease III
MNRKERAAELLKRLPEIYPGAHCELDFRNPLELLVATILSAQCTDKRVNMTTPAVFEQCRTAEEYAAIDQEEMEKMVRSTGFYRNKAKNLRAMGSALVERHGGKVPETLEELAALPGVGRKTANVVLGNAFSKNEGVVVDTHVGRLSQRLGLTKFSDPVRIEQELMKLFPRDSWTNLSHWLIFHGRRRCGARKPDCAGCELRDICPSAK